MERQVNVEPQVVFDKYSAEVSRIVALKVMSDARAQALEDLLDSAQAKISSLEGEVANLRMSLEDQQDVKPDTEVVSGEVM